MNHSPISLLQELLKCGTDIPVWHYDMDGHLLDTNSEHLVLDKILGFIGDKSWFRIKRQDMFVEEFRNPNNRTYQMYLNLIKMYNYSLFANGVILATEQPTVTITGLGYTGSALTIPVGGSESARVDVTPVTGNNPAIVFTSSDTNVATVSADPANPARVIVSGVADGTATITATSGNVTATISVSVGEGE